ncbi:MAG: phosphate/phosphite/phosphonate ABC transporter substrate-binding protein [Pseudomonadota bacterium]
MKIARRVLLAGIVGLASVQAAGSAVADWRDDVEVFRIGILGGVLGEAQLRAFACLDRVLEREMGVPVQLYTSANYDGVMGGLLAGELDAAALGAGGYAGVYLRNPDAIEPLVTVKQVDGSLGYYSVLFVRADSPYESIDDLRGRSIMFTDRNSTSGYLVPRRELNDSGYPLRHFGAYGFSGSHPSAVRSVLEGQFDAGVTWTSGIGDYDKGHSRGNLHRMVRRGDLDMSDLRILWTSKLIPEGPVVVRQSLPQEAKDIYKRVLIELPEKDRSCFEAIAGGAATGYAPVEHELYGTIIDLRRNPPQEG